MPIKIYEEKFSLTGNRRISLRPFISAILPLLKDYSMPAFWNYAEPFPDENGTISSRNILGDEHKAHLVHNVYEGESDPYSGDRGFEIFRSKGLKHSETGNELQISIRINRLQFTNDEIEIFLKGEADVADKIAEIIKQILAD